MNLRDFYAPPTWRQCHPVNIYVYKNGVVGDKPQLVHIPMEKKKNMTTALEEIGLRMKLPVGYPIALYNMDGTRVCKTYELEMYNNYVVVTNLDKRFKCVEYGKVREPLVVNGSHSKHVNALTYERKKFDLFCRKKMARKPLHELMPHGEQDGYGPSELPVGKPCGALCHKIMPTRTWPTQCYSDEIMCVEGAAMTTETDQCREGGAGGISDIIKTPCQNNLLTRQQQCQRASLTKDDPTFQQETELEQLARQVREEVGTSSSTAATHLVDLIQRYKDVGSDIFKMFQDKINQDLDSNISSRWNIPSNLSMETQQKLKDELLKMATAPCDFTFDQFGNFVYSSGCQIGPPAGAFKQDDPVEGGNQKRGSNDSRKSIGTGEVPKRDSFAQAQEIVVNNAIIESTSSFGNDDAILEERRLSNGSGQQGRTSIGSNKRNSKDSQILQSVAEIAIMEAVEEQQRRLSNASGQPRTSFGSNKRNSKEMQQGGDEEEDVEELVIEEAFDMEVRRSSKASSNKSRRSNEGGGGGGVAGKEGSFGSLKREPSKPFGETATDLVMDERRSSKTSVKSHQSNLEDIEEVDELANLSPPDEYR